MTGSVFLGWTDELLRAADVILWLDVPWRVATWRIIARHVRASLAGTNRHPGILRLQRFLRIAKRYYRSSEARPVVLDNDGNNNVDEAGLGTVTRHKAVRQPSDALASAVALHSATGAHRGHAILGSRVGVGPGGDIPCGVPGALSIPVERYTIRNSESSPNQPRNSVNYLSHLC